MFVHDGKHIVQFFSDKISTHLGYNTSPKTIVELTKVLHPTLHSCTAYISPTLYILII